ncbi:ATPase RavA [Maioricimonas rarisocia]|uniref:ATPase RavA n=1 Tax=Maioricimonas rarisocia TaxID=2528026 RepID=A0A517Z3X8_9PLAN|nr:ATPase RavA [Maioricimonas rarisocia]
MTDDAAPPQTPPVDLESVRRLTRANEEITSALSQVIVGQKQVVEQLLVSILAGGHCLLIGVPGLAKTLVVRSLAEVLGLSFNRIQFTPDLMPADITGTDVIQEDRSTGTRDLRFLQGPVFANVVLADEINRTPPKTQAALLEAMQEHQVTVGGQRHRLPEPFFVLATQNPIEQEGTYPLPEAQQDRFMFEIRVDYPTEDEEFDIVRQTTSRAPRDLTAVLSPEELRQLQETVRQVPVADHVIRYALALARLTRVTADDAPDFIRQYVTWGAGPRASQYLILGAKAYAALHGQPSAGVEDVRAVAHPVLRHRIITNYNAEADQVSTDDIIDRLIEQTPTHGAEAAVLERLPQMFRKSS